MGSPMAFRQGRTVTRSQGVRKERVSKVAAHRDDLLVSSPGGTTIARRGVGGSRARQPNLLRGRGRAVGLPAIGRDCSRVGRRLLPTGRAGRTVRCARPQVAACPIAGLLRGRQNSAGRISGADEKGPGAAVSQGCAARCLSPVSGGQARGSKEGGRR